MSVRPNPRDNKCIFQLHPKVHVTIQQARHAYTTCRQTHVNVRPTNDDYAIFCVDGDMVETYLPVVESLERVWNLPRYKGIANYYDTK